MAREASQAGQRLRWNGEERGVPAAAGRAAGRDRARGWVLRGTADVEARRQRGVVKVFAEVDVGVDERPLEHARRDVGWAAVRKFELVEEAVTKRTARGSGVRGGSRWRPRVKAGPEQCACPAAW